MTPILFTFAILPSGGEVWDEERQEGRVSKCVST